MVNPNLTMTTSKMQYFLWSLWSVINIFWYIYSDRVMIYFQIRKITAERHHQSSPQSINIISIIGSFGTKLGRVICVTLKCLLMYFSNFSVIYRQNNSKEAKDTDKIILGATLINNATQTMQWSFRNETFVYELCCMFYCIEYYHCKRFNN